MKRFLGAIENGTVSGDPQTCGDVRVFWRGFIANRRELLDEARRRGEPAADPADGELFARAFRWWGADLQKHVLGEYAVVATDGRTAVLTHDALGLRPLFYRHAGSRLEFASHLEDLVARTGTGELDLEYVAEHLFADQHWGDHTPYRHLRRLRLGRTLVFRDGRLFERATWDLAAVRPLHLRPEEYEERLRELIRDAVVGSSRAGGPVWAELSGGLDSSTVVCSASKAGIPLEAISVVFGRSKRADDSKWMREVLDRHPMPWHRIDGDDPLPFSELPRRFSAEPHFGFVNCGWLRRYEEEVRADVVLTGLGGDQVFVGDKPTPHFLADSIVRPHRMIAEVDAWRGADEAKRSRLHWMLNAVARPWLDFLRGRELRNEGAPPAAPWLPAHRAPRRRGAESLGRRAGSVGAQSFCEELYGYCNQLYPVNQATDAFEYRHPLLYRPLVEFMHAVPWEVKADPRGTRPLQRRALRGLLPERIRLRRSKTDADQPYYEGLRTGRAWIEALTDRPRLVELGLVEGAAWREAVSAARFGQAEFLSSFLATATLEIWLRQFESFRLPPPAADRVGEAA